MEISKELLSEVLGHNDMCNERIVENKLLYMCKNDGTMDYEYEYNIYEFAFDCKEWALSKGYILSSNSYSNGGCCQVIQVDGEECPECGECTTLEYIHSFTEIEAIIKACEWILNEKS